MQATNKDSMILKNSQIGQNFNQKKEQFQNSYDECALCTMDKESWNKT